MLKKVLAGTVLVSLLGFSLAGAGVAEEFSCQIDEKKVVLKSGGETFTVLMEKPYRFLQVGGFTLGLTGWKPRVKFVPQTAALVTDEPNKKVASLILMPQKYDEEKLKENKYVLVPVTGYQAEMNLEIRKGSPAVFVQYRIRNLSDKPLLIIPMWGTNFSKGSYAAGDLTRKDLLPRKDREVKYPRWRKIPWFHILSSDGKGALGIITRTNYGANGNIWFQLDTGLPALESDTYRDNKFILFPAKTAEEVQSFYEKTKNMEWTPFENLPSAGGTIHAKPVQKQKIATKATVKVINNPVEESITQIPFLKTPPKIDGKLSDSVWKEAEKLTQFKESKKGDLAKEQSEVFLGYDADNLYIGCKCYESQMDKLKATVTKRDGRIWQDVCVEIFLDTNCDRSSYYHLLVNLLNTQSDEKRGEVIVGKSWDGEWLSATSKGKDYWNVELAIPFKTLGVDNPGPGTQWAGNFCRYSKPSKEASSWAYVGQRFHSPAKFATLLFGTFKDGLNCRLTKLKGQLGTVKRKTEAKEEAQQIVKRLNERIKDLEKRIKSYPDIDRERYRFFNEDISMLAYRVARAGVTGKKYVIWHKNPMLQLALDEQPPAGTTEDIKELNISCYVNEYESAAFILTNLTDENIPARILVSELNEKIRKTDRKNKLIPPLSPYITVRTASFVKLRDGRILADPLPIVNQAGEVNLSPNEPKQVWLTIHTKDLSPGIYQGDITIKPHYGAEKKSFKLNLTVYPMRLPDKLPLGLWVCNYLRSRFGMRGTSNMTEITEKKYAQDLLDHYVNAFWGDDLVIPPIIIDAKGKVVEPLDKDAIADLDGALSLYKNHGIMLFTMIDARWAGRKQANLPKGTEFMSPEYKRYFKIWLKAFVAHLKKLGLDYDEFYLCIADEAHGKYLKERFAPMCKLIREIDPKVKFWHDSGNNPEDIETIAPYIDLWSPYRSKMTDENIDCIKALGKPFWFYCNEPFAGPGAKRGLPMQGRAYAHFSWKNRLTGCGFWAYNIHYKDAWDDFDHPSRGDASVIYDNVNWPSGPITSRRWEAFREGLEDYTYLYMLRETMEKAKDKRIDTSSAESLMKQFNDEVYNNKDPEIIYRFRTDVSEETVKLNKLMAFEVSAPEVKIKGKEVIITWKTGQPSKVRLFYRREDGKSKWRKYWADIWLTVDADSSTLSKKHSIRLKDLDPEADYSFYTMSTDELGYVVVDDNGGKGYRFKSKE